jgi:hypothetical protein
MFKEQYGDEILQLVPDVAKLIKMVPFVESEKEIGNLYHQPVIVNNEHGVTYAAQNAGAFTLNAAVPLTMKDAQVPGAQILLRSAIDYESAARASNNVKAFKKATGLLVQNMMESMRKRLEIASWYGVDPDGIGQGASSVNTDSTTSVVQISTASWATGIWSGMEGAKIQFYDDAGDSLVSSSADSIFAVSLVNVADRKLTVTGTATGISALDTALAAACNIFFNGAKAKEMSGISKILQNTGSLFNISASTYGLWKGQAHSLSSASLSFGEVVKGIGKAVGSGLDEKVDLFCSTETWNNINTDLAALRRLDGSWKRSKNENGQEGICYYAQNGEIEIHSHTVIKEGEAFALPMKRIKRLGAVDATFKTPGLADDEFFLHLADAAGFELRVYTDQHIFLEMPARGVRFSGIVNQ